MNSQEDPFASARLQPKRSPLKEEQSTNSDDPFGQVRIKDVDGFPGLKEGSRHAARISSRVAETIGGIPGDIKSLMDSGILLGMEKILGPSEALEKVKEHEKNKSIKLPTSSELKQISEEKTGGYTKAQNPIEEIGDEYAQTLASLLGPMKFRKALWVSLGATSAKKGAEIAGLGEGSQEASKLGTMFLLSAFNPGGAMKYASSQYDKANKLSKGASIYSTQLESNLGTLRSDLEKGLTTPGKNVIIKAIDELKSKTSNGKIAVQELTSAKRDLNSLMGDPTVLKREKKLLKTVGKEIDQAIKPYEKINPEFSKAYRPANEIYGAVMQGQKVSQIVNKALGNKSIVGAVLGEIALGHPEFMLPTLVAGVGAKATAHSVDLINRIRKSPELKKYYLKALSAAALEDSASLRLYEDKLKEKLQK